MIKKIAFVAHPTRDMARARKFWGETLGLANSANFGDFWSEFDTPDGKSIALDTFSPKESEQAKVYLALETDDIAKEMARLKERGVEVVRDVWQNDDEQGKEVCKMALILDPEGNVLMLHQIAPHRAKKTGG